MGASGWLLLVLGCAPPESEGPTLDWRWPTTGDTLPAHNRRLWVDLRGEAGPLEWRLNGELLEGEEEEREEGRLFHLTAPLPEGEQVLEVAVGGKGVRWEGRVEANLPPVITLEAGLWREGEPLELRLSVEDGDDPLEVLSLVGTGEGAALLPSKLPPDGRLAWSVWPQEAGSLTIVVTDPLGATAEATARWDLLPEDADGDGWPYWVDCDDGNMDVYPEQVEMCDGVDQDCDGQVDELALDAGLWFVDGDGDFFGDAERAFLSCDGAGGVALGQDCDDSRAASFPGGTELCDGLDNDCDGALDEENPTELLPWYHDDDGDNFGDPSDVVSACAAPPGRVADNTDCNDQDRSAFPGAPEYCDGDDEDCDGTIDEPEAIDASLYFLDSDADGYGGPQSTPACSAPPGYVADNLDCDDTSPDVSPSGTETCDLRDEDCDGQIDEADAVDASTWFLDGDGDGYGGSASTVACTTPPGYLANNQDCDDTSLDVSPEAVEHCDLRDEDCDGQVDEAAIDAPTWYADTDGDGYGGSTAIVTCVAPSGFLANNEDCDDTSIDVSPTGTETCDGRDEDCDGSIDEAAIDALTWYLDADTDGYGGVVSSLACTAPSGYLANNQDCDDASADVSPAGTEHCDLRDEDCDGQVDEAAVDALPWYADTDGDGFGGPTSISACITPAGFSVNNQDCDDTSSDVSPSGTETCDRRDEDCDGSIDEAAIDASIWYADTDGDGYGGAGSTAACTAPSGFLANNQDCDDTSPDVSPTEIETCTNHTDDDCDGQIDGCPLSVADAVALTGESGNLFSEVESGDLDGDGAVEIGAGGGELLWLLPGDFGSSGSVSSQSPRLSGAELSAFALGGDRDGNEAAELWWATSSAGQGGVVWVLEQPTISGDIDSLAQLRLEGQPGEEFGSALAQIDYDFDGIAEILVGAPGGGGPGLVYAWNQVGAGTFGSANADAVLSGAQAGDRAGGGALGAEDLDQDGVEDLWVGTPGAGGGAGGVALIERWEGIPMDLSIADVLWTGLPGEAAGSVVEAVDLDQDGYPELLVGVAASSRLYVLPGPLFASGILEESGARVEGTGALGAAVAGFGQQSGEVLWGVGAPDANVDGVGSGALYLYLGLPVGVYDATEASWVLAGAGGGAGLGGSLAAAGDGDGDGQADLAIGAAGGGVWLYGSAIVE